MKYTPKQLEAIRSVDECLQIIACAGSGKTQVISARIVEILKQKAGAGITPANIVAFTFTEKAAGELKDRIHRLCLEQLSTDQGLAEMFVGTIHGYCLNLLQSPPLYRYLKCTVLNEVQQRLFIDRHSKAAGLTECPLLSGGTLKRWKDSALYQWLLSILAEGEVDPKRVPPDVSAARDRYYALCNQYNYLDFSRILAEAVEEIRTNDQLRAAISDRVKYLVVDEYQDVNPLQEALIREIHQLGANLCVVGDDDQTIYQWRGSDVGNILTFQRRYHPVKSVNLEQNFRSSNAIVSVARDVVQQNPDRLPKKMVGTQAQPYQRGDILALSFPNPAAEAEWIAQKIRSLYGTEYHDRPGQESRGLTYADFAILLRSVRNDAAPIVEALKKAGIPYVVCGMNNLFDTPEVQAMRRIFFYLGDFTPPGEVPITANDLPCILREAHLALSPAQVEAGVRFLLERKARMQHRIVEELRLQRLYLDFLAAICVREEAITKQEAGSSRTGEIVYYNLGKFSQVISDFEQIHFRSRADDLYREFASFLHYQAPNYYPEGWEEAGAVRPDAVQILTVHRAKGMQWPAVFVPCLRQGRFPAKRVGGRSVWSILPESAVTNAERYKGTLEDERRLFYVALTRAERYLFCSWAPRLDVKQRDRVSVFFNEVTQNPYVLTREPQGEALPRATPRPRVPDVSLPLTFSQLKYYFICPYQFKLRFLYGFNPPIDEALGYGKSLHDALAEIHAEALHGRIAAAAEVPRLVQDHLHLPFANPEVQGRLKAAACKALENYLIQYGRDLTSVEHVEKPIQIHLGDGIVVSGRIDLIRRLDTNEVVIVDFKSTHRAEVEDTSHEQLRIYAVGYQQLTGQSADLIEVHNLDAGGSQQEVVDQALLKETREKMRAAGQHLRANRLPRQPRGHTACTHCDHKGICR